MLNLFSLKQEKKDESAGRGGGTRKRASAAQLRITKVRRGLRGGTRKRANSAQLRITKVRRRLRCGTVKMGNIEQVFNFTVK
jgi:hypothetical protein